MHRLGSPWPDTATVADGVLVIGGRTAPTLAAEHGTPLYVYDATTLLARARIYADAAASHPGGGQAVVACKANGTVGILRLLASAGLGADVSSPGELAAADRAGIPAGRIVYHGNAKSDAELDVAVAAGCALIVVDNVDEPARIAAAASRQARRQPVAVRVTPGIVAGGHSAVETGGPGSKFGLAPTDAVACIAAIQLEPRLAWRGLHVHLGSQISDAAALETAVAWLAGFCLEHRLDPGLVDLGGGLAIAYEHEPAPDAAAVVARLSAAVAAAFPRAELWLEPGRSVVGAAGVTLYTVVTTKVAADGTRWAALDGGMSDNVRPALYGARYLAAAAARLDDDPVETVSLAGRHCESGDVLVRDAQLPPLRPGDLIALAATGAYGQSMASTYNGTPRPAAVVVEDGRSTLVTRRETVDELLVRDV